MNIEMYNIIKNNNGFIAALDQSGGSSAKTLRLYGITETSYNSEDEMFDLIHEMRKRVFTSNVFTNEHILGTILFEKTMNSKIGDDYSADYLWNKKGIVSFLKVDKGLQDENNNVKLMKDIPDLIELLNLAKKRNIFGTKMRSVIYDANRDGIREVVKQQFAVAKVICNKGLIPIIEPEVDINVSNKELCEEILKEEIINILNSWNEEDKIMFKFTIPNIDNFYKDLYEYNCVVRIVALSGGYDIDTAVTKLSKNDNMIASFSRALLQDLSVNQTDGEFDNTLNTAIIKIYNASVN